MMAIFGLFTVSLGAYGSLAWSLVPVGFSGRVDRIDYQSDTGSRFRELMLVDGRALTVDRRVAHLFDRAEGPTGQWVHKEPWSGTLQIGDRTDAVAPSPEFWKVLFALTAVSVAAVMRTLRARQGGIELGGARGADAPP